MNSNYQEAQKMCHNIGNYQELIDSVITKITITINNNMYCWDQRGSSEVSLKSKVYVACHLMM